MKKQFALLLALIAISLAGLACAMGGTPAVTKIELCSDVQDNNQCIDPTNSFTPSQRDLHALVYIQNMTVENQLTVKWYVISAQDAEGKQYGNEEINNAQHSPGSGTGTIDFTLKTAVEWPVGSYKVEVYLDDTLAQTAEFSIAP